MNETKDSKIEQEIWNPEEQGLEKTELQTASTDSEKSALQKYQEVVIGSASLFALLKYEVLTSLIGPLPGAAGLVLRKKYFRQLIKSILKIK